MRFAIAAFPLYPDGATGDAIADVEADGLSSALGELEERVLEWWPPERHENDGDTPDALDVTISWGPAS
jgi:hypothetical protein